VAGTQARTRNPRGQGERLREALLDAAIELLGEVRDLDELSVRAVTARAGVSPTALYLHFADKQELVTAVKDRCFAELRSYLLAAQEETASAGPRDQLRAMGLAYLDFAAERPGAYRIIFHERLHPPAATDPMPTPRPTRREVPGPPEGASAFADLVAAVERCLPAGADVFDTAIMLWSGLHGLAGLLTMTGFPFPSRERCVQLLVDAYVPRG
jgi:AcrR family transcriptional regulator